MPSAVKQQQVKQFFDGYAKDFNSIYQEHEKSVFNRSRDRFLRASMFSRFEEAYNYFKAHNIKSLIDVGCGPGVHDVLLAKGLDMNITGVDISTSMIEVAKKNANDNNLSEKCNFKVGNFFDLNFDQNFEASLCVGVLEYIEDPSSFIKKMIDCTSKAVLFSLPVKYHWLTPQRSLRYKLRKCPLWFYTENDIHKLMKTVGVERYIIKKLNRDYLVIVEKAE